MVHAKATLKSKGDKTSFVRPVYAENVYDKCSLTQISPHVSSERRTTKASYHVLSNSVFTNTQSLQATQCFDTMGAALKQNYRYIVNCKNV